MAVALQKARPTTLADMQLVEPRKEGPVPNHLLETSECLNAFYMTLMSKLSRDCYVKHNRVLRFD